MPAEAQSLLPHAAQDDKQPDEDQNGGPEKFPSHIPEPPVIRMEKGDVSQKKVSAEYDQEDADDEGSGRVGCPGPDGLRRRHTRLRDGIHISGPLPGLVGNDYHAYYIGDKGYPACEDEKNGYKAYQHRIDIKILRDSAAYS